MEVDLMLYLRHARKLHAHSNASDGMLQKLCMLENAPLVCVSMASEPRTFSSIAAMPPPPEAWTSSSEEDEDFA